MKRSMFTKAVGREYSLIVDVTQLINIVVSLLYSAAALLDWHTRATGFLEKGSPPPMKLWAVIVIDEPGITASVLIVLGILCAAGALGHFICNRSHQSMICINCGYPENGELPCPECGGNRTVRAGEAASRHWAWYSAICLFIMIFAVGLSDLAGSVFDVVRWLVGAEYAGGYLGEWPLGLELGIVPTVALWTTLTLLAVTESIVLRESSASCTNIPSVHSG